MVSSFKNLALISGAFTLALGAPMASLSAAPDRAGAQRGGAKSSVNRPPPQGGAKRSGGNNGGNTYAGGNKPGVNKQGGKRPGGGGNNIGNTVVVAPGHGGGNHNNGYNNNNYNGNNNWDNDDDDFLEFVGKTAAITAGVSVVAAVIGSQTNQKPSGCQESVSNGQLYMYCNGNWYQPIQNGSSTSYQVVNPPR